MLAKRLIELIKDKELRNKLGNKSAEYAQLYAWENISEKMIEVYNQVLEKH
jgi:glycosyltransferase involved in cell wall biosynthesis